MRDALQCVAPVEDVETVFAAMEATFETAVRGVCRRVLPVSFGGIAPRPVGVTLFEQPNRWVIHFVSLGGDSTYKSDRIKSVEEGPLVCLRIPAGLRVKRLHRLWGKAEVPFAVKGDRLEAWLNKIGEYEVLVAEFTPAPGKP